MKKVSVITINYGTKDLTKKVLQNFKKKERDLDAEIILINNKSAESFEASDFVDLADKIIENKKNVGFAKAVNQGLKLAQGKYILLLNSDLFIKENSVSKMIAYLSASPTINILGPKILFPDGSFQISFGRFPNAWREFLRLFGFWRFLPGGTISNSIRPKSAHKVDWVSGACMLFRKKLLDRIGTLDENYFLGVEDIDFSYRAGNVVYYPVAKVYHKLGASSGGTATVERIKRDRDGMVYFMKKHFPQKKISIFLIKLMHNIKICIKQKTQPLP